MAADELVGTWRANLFAEETSLQLRGNHQVEVEGDTAILRSVAHAWNKQSGFEGGDLREVCGDYEYRCQGHADGWKITSFALSPKHRRGNDGIPAHRPERA